jgi:6-phosphogluconolactonase (cycloisomerase 2 family)
MLSWIRNGRPGPRASVAARTRLNLENLEDRILLSTLYVESNNPDLGENAVLAFSRNPSDGSLTQIGTYPTGGTGQFNLPKALGPDDSDREVVATPDGSFLFAVNQGSNSITSFSIGPDGGLTLIGTFDSGGVQPDSLGICAGRLYVANRGDATSNQPGTVAPNYTGFVINDDGSLMPIPGSTVTFPVGTSPAQALISPTGSFLFADIYGLSGSTDPQSNTIAPFLIQPDGTLQLAPGGNASDSADPPGLLGTAAHPTLNIVYAGLPRANEIGVFIYDETGQIAFNDSVPDQGRAACWCVVSADGNFLYVATTGTDSIGVFSLSDPLHPAQIQELALSHAPEDQNQSLDFQIALDPSGQSLYVVNQSTNPTGTNHRGNQLHVLSVASDGTLSEPNGPIVFSPADVPANAHPQGIAIVSNPGGPAPSAGGGLGLGRALLAFVQIQESERSSQLGPVTDPVADLQLTRGSPGELPFLVQHTAGTTDTLPQRAATIGEVGSRVRHDGQRLDSSELDAARLDAFFGSAAGTAIAAGTGHLLQGSR